ncbi:hypothetical protein MFIFM68171_06629 [Madurella fahalii]|uniref:TMEM205-like domain-containing protein n=1 Tax=Madurella fahalii TaxID=1157608 RepID=A0ABQ0GF76_9PEZI
MDLLTSAASSLFESLAPFHLLLYSTLLGTEMFQTFVNTKVCFDALPRSAFTTLQKRIFPVYFRGQTVLLLLSAVTFPPHGLPSLARQMADWIPYAVAGTTSLLNLLMYGPKTRQAMIDCIHQETRDTRADPARARNHADKVISPDMKRLKRAFSRNHAMTIHLNLITIGAMLCYGWRLASRLTFESV